MDETGVACLFRPTYLTSLISPRACLLAAPLTCLQCTATRMSSYVATAPRPCFSSWAKIPGFFRCLSPPCGLAQDFSRRMFPAAVLLPVGAEACTRACKPRPPTPPPDLKLVQYTDQLNSGFPTCRSLIPLRLSCPSWPNSRQQGWASTTWR